MEGFRRVSKKFETLGNGRNTVLSVSSRRGLTQRSALPRDRCLSSVSMDKDSPLPEIKFHLSSVPQKPTAKCQPPLFLPIDESSTTKTERVTKEHECIYSRARIPRREGSVSSTTTRTAGWSSDRKASGSSARSQDHNEMSNSWQFSRRSHRPFGRNTPAGPDLLEQATQGRPANIPPTSSRRSK